MAKRYEADKMIQLIRLCSWKARTDMNQSGLIALAGKLGEIPGKKETAFNERYLVDLLSDANTALKKDDDRLVHRQQEKIQPLLEYAQCASWDQWVEMLSDTGNYIQLEKIGFASLPGPKIAVWYSDLLPNDLRQLLATIKRGKSYPYPIEEIVQPEKAPAAYAKELIKGLDQFMFIIWAIPSVWKDQISQMKDPSWDELTETGRIVPVWVDPENPSSNTFFIPGIKQPGIAGITGLLTSLLYLDQKITNPFGDDKQKTSESANVPFTSHEYHNHSTGQQNNGNGTQNNNIQYNNLSREAESLFAQR